MKILHPSGWKSARGYANGIAARGTLVFIGGQIGWNAAQQFESDDFVAQAKTALANVVAVLAEANGRPEHIVRMTWYVVDKREYLAAQPALGVAYRDASFEVGHGVGIAAGLGDRDAMDRSVELPVAGARKPVVRAC